MVDEQQNLPHQANKVMILLGLMWIILALVIVALQFVMSPKIEIEWETETEIDTAGFNIYRSDTADGEYLRINEQIIPSQSDAVSGASYIFKDNDVERGKTYYYQLEDIEYDNSTQRHETLIGEVTGLNWWTIPLALVSGVIGAVMIVSGLRPRKTNETT
jgi:hypothetical protein